MKGRQWHIRTRILVTLMILTTAILLAVAAAFNLFIRGYVRGRVSDQLDSLAGGAATYPREDMWEWGTGNRGGRGRAFDEHPDRVIGTKGSAVVLDTDGTVLSVLHGEPEVGDELSAYFRSGSPLSQTVQKKILSLDSGTYVISVAQDPVQADAWLVYYVDVTSIMAFTGQVNLVLGVIIFAAILLSLLLSRWVARSFAEPVQKLSAFAEEVGGGNFQKRDLRFRDAEFNQLADSMNRMAAELLEANQKQEIFFQNVSHELRTPLTSIRGNAEGILYGVMEPEPSSKIILSETDRLSGLVEDLLYLSRMGKGGLQGDAPPIDLREVLSLCVSEQRAERRSLSFRFDFDDSPVPLAIREQDARQLFGNLLSNAIRYAAGEIRLSCHQDTDGIAVSVSDDGPGISPGDLLHIFERFYKGAGGKHGIGLSIVRSVADAYHGTISVNSDGGAAFTVRFPFS